MKSVYMEFVKDFTFTLNIKKDIENFLNFHHENETFRHTIRVASEAIRIAKRFNADPEPAEQAGLLHDVSNVIPTTTMMSIAEELSIEILEEELRYPRIIHQKLSKSMSIHLFGCSNTDVLNAIECHTTLKAGASQFDKILFVADKISWDLPGDHPYQERMREKLDWLDLDGAVLVYLDHVWGQRDKLKLVHPWLIEAREQLLLNQ